MTWCTQLLNVNVSLVQTHYFKHSTGNTLRRLLKIVKILAWSPPLVLAWLHRAFSGIACCEGLCKVQSDNLAEKCTARQGNSGFSAKAFSSALLKGYSLVTVHNVSHTAPNSQSLRRELQRISFYVITVTPLVTDAESEAVHLEQILSLTKLLLTLQLSVRNKQHYNKFAAHICTLPQQPNTHINSHTKQLRSLVTLHDS